MGKKILVICTGNTCRSQMAEGFLKSFDPGLEVFSAGTFPGKRVNPNAVKVMKELDIDISHQIPEKIDQYIGEEWDYVITVCGGANESCPAFTGRVKNRLHIGFDDPADSMGDEEEVLAEYRRVRDEIKAGFFQLYNKIR
jgi:arsenate reductase (thioredoxin)